MHKQKRVLAFGAIGQWVVLRLTPWGVLQVTHNLSNIILVSPWVQLKTARQYVGKTWLNYSLRLRNEAGEGLRFLGTLNPT